MKMSRRSQSSNWPQGDVIEKLMPRERAGFVRIANMATSRGRTWAGTSKRSTYRLTVSIWYHLPYSFLDMISRRPDQVICSTMWDNSHPWSFLCLSSRNQRRKRHRPSTT